MEHRTKELKDFFVHLRLKFNLMLVPLWLFGVSASGGSASSVQFWLEFLIFHICLYGGANSLNSYYDRDEGPIGGLEKPPPISDSILYLSWITQLIGFVGLIVWGKNPLLLWYIAGVFMSVMYSHPSFRFKGKPMESVLTVSILQGFGAFSAGWISGGADLSEIVSLKGVLGGLGIALLTAGMYPLTQLYQLESDKKNGDFTLSRALGIKGSFNFAISTIALSGVSLTWMIAKYISIWESILTMFFFAASIVRLLNWSHAFKSNTNLENFHFVHRFGASNSLLLFLFTMSHIVV